MKIVIVIPVYKEKLSEDESLSLKQCFKILSNYEIKIVCPTSLNIRAYENIIDKAMIAERFAPEYFNGIEGYNKLMTSNSFYRRFKNYDYMLIYQLDAWVFYDALNYWCEKGYDYVGAPWFELHKTYEDGYGLWCCGNGGLSLRKIKKMIQVTNPYATLYPIKTIFKQYFSSFKTIGKGFIFLLYKNNLRWFRKNHLYLWEDTYFCYGLDETRFRLKRPTPEESAQFSFECSPAYLYSLLGNVLPFGCHAYKKYQYKEFWSKFIPEIRNNETKHSNNIL